jgi:hypothetical protein
MQSNLIIAFVSGMILLLTGIVTTIVKAWFDRTLASRDETHSYRANHRIGDLSVHHCFDLIAAMIVNMDTIHLGDSGRSLIVGEMVKILLQEIKSTWEFVIASAETRTNNRNEVVDSVDNYRRQFANFHIDIVTLYDKLLETWETKCDKAKIPKGAVALFKAWYLPHHRLFPRIVHHIVHASIYQKQYDKLSEIMCFLELHVDLIVKVTLTNMSNRVEMDGMIYDEFRVSYLEMNGSTEELLGHLIEKSELICSENVHIVIGDTRRSHFAHVSNTLVSLTGFSDYDILSTRCKCFQVDAMGHTNPVNKAPLAYLQAHLRQKKSTMVNLVNYTRHGKPFQNYMYVTYTSVFCIAIMITPAPGQEDEYSNLDNLQVFAETVCKHLLNSQWAHAEVYTCIMGSNIVTSFSKMGLSMGQSGHHTGSYLRISLVDKLRLSDVQREILEDFTASCQSVPVRTTVQELDTPGSHTILVNNPLLPEEYMCISCR